ncbi:MAG: hypothetical protein Q4D80_06895 [Pseudomonadota bacterium]|nr:hypothetical protein [Pseudomonadota bacterium]
MEQREKFKKLDSLAGELGLQADEVAAYFQQKGQPETKIPKKVKNLYEATVKPAKPKDLSAVTILRSKEIVPPRVIEPGMFLYEDGLVYPGSIEGNRITSVIGYVGKHSGLAVCLKDEQKFWSSDRLCINVSSRFSGMETTRRILEEALRQGKRAEAARYCFEYAEDGVKAGEAFLPTQKELDAVYQNKERVQHSLSLIHAFNLKKLYWSSSSAGRDAWFFDFRDGTENGALVSQTAYVRPFLSFTF